MFIREDWMQEAECLRAPDPNIFFPSPANYAGVVAEARRYCWRCVVQDECLEYSLRNKIDYGIFAGLLPDQRRMIQRRRSREALSQRKSSG